MTDRLLAKQAINMHGASCSSLEPNPKLIKGIVNGTCHRRYVIGMNSNKESNQQMTIEGLNEDDEDMYAIDNALHHIE